MLKYIDTYGWPFSNILPNDAQQVLDAFVWYYNRVFHKGINTIPYEVFHAYDINRQKIVHKYPIYPVGTVVIRKPIRMGGYVPIGVFNFEQESFVVNRVEGKLQEKYELRSLVTCELREGGISHMRSERS